MTSGIQTRIVLEADVVSYSAAADVIEGKIGARGVAAFNDAIARSIAAAIVSAGVLVDDVLAVRTGDGAICTFEDASCAHRVAENLHRRIGVDLESSPSEFSFRVGLATGSISWVGGTAGTHEIAGIAISRAVRLEAKATAGGICADRATVTLLPRADASCYAGPMLVDGKRGERFEAFQYVVVPAIVDAGRTALAQEPYLQILTAGPDQKRNVLIALERLFPEESLDLLMFLLEMPVAVRPSRHQTAIGRSAELLTWVESSVGPGLDALEDEIRFLSERH